ncbi:hypothetical protein VNI00_010148 [Paramarasmius palmivorus]|uniref:Bromodomain associated domain-containing protein n=1 Tax=Paramarasmius palmivorus TaxID=297713 RepID=A0AAW0CHD4_9AGAR
MDAATHKLLESVTQRTLHAHNFSRTSSQASLVLTDLLARYLTLLAGTCARYAEHANRKQLNARDAVRALDDLGVSIEELNDYCRVEGMDMVRNGYSNPYHRRAQDFQEFRSQLNDGLRGDRDDSIQLKYSQLPEDWDGEESSEPEEEDDAMDVDVEVGQKRASPSPPSPPLSPKRPRISTWEPPPHIPDFLPPFPKSLDASLPPDTETDGPDVRMQPPEDKAARMQEQDKMQAPLDIPSPSATSSDYNARIPYDQSSLANVPSWHLPAHPPNPPEPQSQNEKHKQPLNTEQDLLRAYHHILTNPTQIKDQGNPQRHKVAMALLGLTQTSSRWELPDTLYSNVSSNQPRVVAIGPTYPLALGTDPEKDKKETDFKFPAMAPRSVSSSERMSWLVGQQGSRIPELARHVLHPNIYSRTTRLNHPPVLSRGTKQLIYGPGVPAPWNANLIPPQETAKEKEKEKDGGAQVNGVKKDPAALPDARLFATWEYERKDYNVPLQKVNSTRGRIVSGQGPTITVNPNQRRRA